MKNSVAIIIVFLLLFVFGMQIFMFYRINERLDQRFALEKNLTASSHQGSDTWTQNFDNWNPYQELLQIRNQIERMFNDTFSRFQMNSDAGSYTKIPAIDLKDEPNHYIVTVNVPGADESSLDVALNGRQLTISIKTESTNEQTASNSKYLIRERFKGEFQRSLTLPGDVDQASMKTEYNNGVLKITLSKA